MPSITAFFDMDYTVLDDSSGLLYVKYLRQQKRIGTRALARIAWWSLMYKIAAIDVNSAVPKMLSYSESRSAAQLMAEADEWFDHMLKAHVAPRAIERIDFHRQQQHQVVLISASTQFSVEPVAKYLQLEYLCTRLIDHDDHLSGEIVEPPCYGPGKIFWAQRYVDEHQSSLADAYLYTDSHSDLPLLELVGHPVAVNPDKRLKQIAQKRSWPIERFY